MVVRLPRSRGLERTRLKWIALGATWPAWIVVGDIISFLAGADSLDLARTQRSRSPSRCSRARPARRS
jgi:hypothetical protein